MGSADLPSAPLAGAALQQLFARQGVAALRLRTSTAAQRQERIRRLRNAVIAHASALYRAGAADLHKPSGEVDLTEILPVCAEANAALRHLPRWMQPRPVRATWLTLGTRSYVQHQARGRCLIIGPFNYPLGLTLGPLVSALAAGNTAVLKPSEHTPQLSACIARIVQDTFPEDEVAVVQGGADVAQALQTLPFDHVFFTGSPANGQRVMAAAAQHLSSLTLELGGKSPAIVDASANLALAATNILWAKCANAGQTCIAPDHVYVHAQVKDAWIAQCRRVLHTAFGSALDDPQATALAHHPHWAHMVNAPHTQRVQSLLADAQARGAHTVLGGGVNAPAHCIAPTLLEHLPAGAQLMEEEIFGPLLPIIPFEDIAAVLDRIQQAPAPLALYLYSQDPAWVRHVLQHTRSGTACVNHALLQFLHTRLPFGGLGHSGLGSAHGYAGFQAFSHARAVLQTQWPWLTQRLRPGEVPPWMRRLLRALWKQV